MAAAAAAEIPFDIALRAPNIINPDDDGWCLYYSILAAFAPYRREIMNADARQRDIEALSRRRGGDEAARRLLFDDNADSYAVRARWARQFAFLLAKSATPEQIAAIDDIIAIGGVDVFDASGNPTGAKGILTQEPENDASRQYVLSEDGENRMKFIPNATDFLKALYELREETNDKPRMWGDLNYLGDILKSAIRPYANLRFRTFQGHEHLEADGRIKSDIPHAFGSPENLVVRSALPTIVVLKIGGHFVLLNPPEPAIRGNLLGDMEDNIFGGIARDTNLEEARRLGIYNDAELARITAPPAAAAASAAWMASLPAAASAAANEDLMTPPPTIHGAASGLVHLVGRLARHMGGEPALNVEEEAAIQARAREILKQQIISRAATLVLSSGALTVDAALNNASINTDISINRFDRDEIRVAVEAMITKRRSELGAASISLLAGAAASARTTPAAAAAITGVGAAAVSMTPAAAAAIPFEEIDPIIAEYERNHQARIAAEAAVDEAHTRVLEAQASSRLSSPIVGAATANREAAAVAAATARDIEAGIFDRLMRSMPQPPHSSRTIAEKQEIAKAAVNWARKVAPTTRGPILPPRIHRVVSELGALVPATDSDRIFQELENIRAEHKLYTFLWKLQYTNLMGDLTPISRSAASVVESFDRLNQEGLDDVVRNAIRSVAEVGPNLLRNIRALQAIASIKNLIPLGNILQKFMLLIPYFSTETTRSEQDAMIGLAEAIVRDPSINTPHRPYLQNTFLRGINEPGVNRNDRILALIQHMREKETRPSGAEGGEGAATAAAAAAAGLPGAATGREAPVDGAAAAAGLPGDAAAATGREAPAAAAAAAAGLPGDAAAATGREAPAAAAAAAEEEINAVALDDMITAYFAADAARQAEEAAERAAISTHGAAAAKSVGAGAGSTAANATARDTRDVAQRAIAAAHERAEVARREEAARLDQLLRRMPQVPRGAVVITQPQAQAAVSWARRVAPEDRPQILPRRINTVLSALRSAESRDTAHVGLLLKKLQRERTLRDFFMMVANPKPTLLEMGQIRQAATEIQSSTGFLDDREERILKAIITNINASQDNPTLQRNIRAARGILMGRGLIPGGRESELLRSILHGLPAAVSRATPILRLERFAVRSLANRINIDTTNLDRLKLENHLRLVLIGDRATNEAVLALRDALTRLEGAGAGATTLGGTGTGTGAAQPAAAAAAAAAGTGAGRPAPTGNATAAAAAAERARAEAEAAAAAAAEEARRHAEAAAAAAERARAEAEAARTIAGGPAATGNAAAAAEEARIRAEAAAAAAERARAEEARIRAEAAAAAAAAAERARAEAEAAAAAAGAGAAASLGGTGAGGPAAQPAAVAGTGALDLAILPTVAEAEAAHAEARAALEGLEARVPELRRQIATARTTNELEKLEIRYNSITEISIPVQNYIVNATAVEIDAARLVVAARAARAAAIDAPTEAAAIQAERAVAQTAARAATIRAEAKDFNERKMVSIIERKINRITERLEQVRRIGYTPREASSRVRNNEVKLAQARRNLTIRRASAEAAREELRAARLAEAAITARAAATNAPTQAAATEAERVAAEAATRATELRAAANAAASAPINSYTLDFSFLDNEDDDDEDADLGGVGGPGAPRAGPSAAATEAAEAATAAARERDEAAAALARQRETAAEAARQRDAAVAAAAAAATRQREADAAAAAAAATVAARQREADAAAAAAAAAATRQQEADAAAAAPGADDAARAAAEAARAGAARTAEAAAAAAAALTDAQANAATIAETAAAAAAETATANAAAAEAARAATEEANRIAAAQAARDAAAEAARTAAITATRVATSEAARHAAAAAAAATAAAEEQSTRRKAHAANAKQQAADAEAAAAAAAEAATNAEAEADRLEEAARDAAASGDAAAIAEAEAAAAAARTEANRLRGEADAAANAATAAHATATAAAVSAGHPSGSVCKDAPPDATPNWASTILPDAIPEKCATSPFITPDCIAKGIQHSAAVADRHAAARASLRAANIAKYNEDPLLLEAIVPGALTGDKLSRWIQLSDKYPDRRIKVRDPTTGRIEEFAVSNPYRAKRYRDKILGPTGVAASFANPTGAALAVISDPSGGPAHHPENVDMMRQNAVLLKKIAPPELVSNNKIAVALLESLWFCGTSPNIASDPRCFPARALGELREYQATKTQEQQAALAKEAMETSRWSLLKRSIGSFVGPFTAALPDLTPLPKQPVPAARQGAQIPSLPPGFDMFRRYMESRTSALQAEIDELRAELRARGATPVTGGPSGPSGPGTGAGGASGSGGSGSGSGSGTGAGAGAGSGFKPIVPKPAGGSAGMPPLRQRMLRPLTGAAPLSARQRFRAVSLI